MARVKSKKYTGVYLNHLQNGDITYYVTYKDKENKLKWYKVGNKNDSEKEINEKYCDKVRNGLINKVFEGEEIITPKTRKQKKVTTINDIFELYKEVKSDNNKKFIFTERKYESNILPKLGHKDIHKLTTDEIIKFRKYLKEDKKLADATVNGNITFIGTLFNYAIEEGIYTKLNPVKNKKLKNYKLDNARDRYLTIEEIKELLEAVADEEVLNTFVQLSLSTGGRLETILNIQKKDIDIKNQSITLKDFKTNTTYKGFLTDDTIQLINEKISKLTINSHIVGGATTKFATRTLQRKLQNIINELFNKGLEKSDTKNRAVIHTLRHTFASHLAINKAPIILIKDLMNHSDIKMTLRYAKLAPNSGLDEVRKLFI